MCFDILYNFWYSVQILIICTTFDILHKFLCSIQLLIFCTTFDILYNFWYSVQLLTFCTTFDILYNFLYSVQLLIFCTTFVRNIYLSKKNSAKCDENVYRSACKVPLFSSDCDDTWILLLTLTKNTQISNFMEIRPVGAELFHADGRTDRHDETDSRFS
jgi:hypothetical protein